MNIPDGITPLPNGDWTITNDSHLSKWAREHGNIVTDPHLFRWLKPYLTGVKAVLELGANIGDHTLQYLNWNMEVTALEPNLIAFQCLAHNCPQATCLNVAASDTEGELPFARLTNVGASRVSKGGDILVPAITVDSLDLPAVDYLKADIEGFEVFALRGAMSTLRKHRPIVFIEVNEGALDENGHTAQDIIEIFSELGYAKIQVYPEQANPDWPQYDLLFLP